MIITFGLNRLVKRWKTRREDSLLDRMPITIMYLGNGNYLNDSLSIDLLEDQLQINKSIFFRNVLTSFDAFPIKIIFGAEKNEFEDISPDKVLSIESSDPNKRIEALNPTGSYQQMQEQTKQMKKDLKRKFLLPDLEMTNESGYAKALSMQPLIEKRESDLNRLYDYENDLADLINQLKINFTQDGQAEPEIDFNVIFDVKSLIIDPPAELEHDKQKLSDGLISLEIFMSKWGETEAGKEIALLIMERREIYKNIYKGAENANSSNNIN